MVAVVVMAVMVMAVPGVGGTPGPRLLRLGRHGRPGLSFPLAKPVPVHAEIIRENWEKLDNAYIALRHSLWWLECVWFSSEIYDCYKADDGNIGLRLSRVGRATP